jgi:hypothetical protein
VLLLLSAFLRSNHDDFDNLSRSSLISHLSSRGFELDFYHGCDCQTEILCKRGDLGLGRTCIIWIRNVGHARLTIHSTSYHLISTSDGPIMPYAITQSARKDIFSALTGSSGAACLLVRGIVIGKTMIQSLFRLPPLREEDRRKDYSKFGFSHLLIRALFMIYPLYPRTGPCLSSRPVIAGILSHHGPSQATPALHMSFGPPGLD